MASISHGLLMALPHSLRHRFSSLDKYTREITVRQLDARHLSKVQRRQFLHDHLADIQAAVLVIVVCRYLEDGIKAAEGAVNIARSFDVDGFTVGSTDFSEGSRDIAAWKRVHSKLVLLLGEYQIDQFAAGRYPWDYVANMLRVLLDAQMD